MKSALFFAGLVIATFPTALLASPNKNAVKAVIKAVKQGDDLSVAFPTAITATEIASLKRVAKCSALNLMKQKGGYYTVVWDCGSKGALRMKVVVSQSSVTSISTAEVGMGSNTCE